jgi:5-methyltetrahydrofolate--homocysteine methyltransferase
MNRNRKAMLERIVRGEVLISDGAMGTYLHAAGLDSRECPESWCLSHPEVVRGIATAYVSSGSDIVETNSFGGNSFRLASFHLASKVREFNLAAAALAREAMGDKGYVAASVGPTALPGNGEGGTISAEQLYDSFVEQMTALAEGGADALCIETMSSLTEATQAIRAAKENTRLPVICTFAFGATPRGFFTQAGVTPEQAATGAAEAGADIVGANCGIGIEDMIPIVRRMRAALPGVPILIHVNAGMNTVMYGKVVFNATPEYMALHVEELIRAGANIIGGCCGTTPDHIAAMARTARNFLTMAVGHAGLSLRHRV